MSLHGLQVSIEAAYASAICDAVEAAENHIQWFPEICHAVFALTQFNLSSDIRYRDPEELPDHIKNALPPLSAVMQQMGVGGWPKEIRDAVKELGGLTKGIKSIAIRGLPPNKLEIVFKCRNFMLTKVLSKLIDLTELPD